MAMAYVQNFEACMTLCDKTPGCVDVSFVKNSGGACYPKSGLGNWVSDDRILAGRLLAPGTSSSSVISSLSTTVSSSTTAAATSTSRSSSTSTTATPIPSIVPGFPAVDSYNYVGCWTDNVGLGLGRALGAVGALVNTTSMTPAVCASSCTQYAYFGVEYGSECYVGLLIHRPHSS
jgi:hypothetical protein